MKLPTPLCIVLEKTINALIDLDPESKTRLSGLQGQIIRLYIQGPELDIYLLVHSDEIEVMSAFDGDVDSTITGSVASLLAMRESSNGLFAGDVEISGNIETGKKFKRYLDSMDIDWEEHLSRVVGDTAAYQSGLLFRNVKTFIQQNNQSLLTSLGEYFTEEAELTAPTSEVRHFEQDVDSARMAADRLSARIALLEKKQEKPT